MNITSHLTMQEQRDFYLTLCQTMSQNKERALKEPREELLNEMRRIRDERDMLLDRILVKNASPWFYFKLFLKAVWRTA